MKKFIELAIQLNDYYLMDKLFGKVYDESYLKKIIFGSDYIIFGRGVINKESLSKLEKEYKIEDFKENFIQIQTKEEFQNFQKKVEFEKKENKQQIITSSEELKTKLRKAIEENTSENISDEDKNKIFEIVLECPIQKDKIEPYYWKVFDIIGNAEKTRNIFNVKDGIRINKNDFPQKNRKKEKEEI